MEKTGIRKVGAYIPRKTQLPSWVRHSASVILGGVVGLITGMLGGGGGSLIVPLYQATGMEERASHATAIATILPLSIVGGIIYAQRGNYPYTTAWIVTLGVVIGGGIGSLLLKRINPRLLSLVFYLIMIYAGIKCLIA